MNWLLLTGCMLLVIGFKTSSSAGRSVRSCGDGDNGHYIVYLLFRGAELGLEKVLIGPVCLGFLFIDLAYFLANTLKFFDGGYVPIMIALFLFSLMLTWQWGRAQLADAFSSFLKIPYGATWS